MTCRCDVPIGGFLQDLWARRAGPAQVDDDVTEDGEQPGAERSELRVEPIARAPCANKGLLDRLLGEPWIAQRAHREAVELAAVGGVRLANARFADQRVRGHA
jgi:hypothetical protein